MRKAREEEVGVMKQRLYPEILLLVYSGLSEGFYKFFS